jgi:hypothetical protein
MKTGTKFLKLIPLLAITIAVISGCSATKSVATDNSTQLKYRFMEGNSYTYLQNSDMTQTVIYMGQEMGSVIKTSLGFTVTRDGFEDGKISLNTTIDTLGVSLQAIQGSFASDIADVKGKNFTFNISETGEESNLQGAAEIKYSMAGQETNLKPLFQLFFQDLPAEAVTVGYTWNDADTIDLSTGSETASMTISSINTITGKESVNGFDCFVIKITFTGVRDSGSDTPQGYISTVGDMVGEGTIYFAPAEGIMVKDNTKVKIDGSVNIPTGESLGMIIESEYTTILKK